MASYAIMLASTWRDEQKGEYPMPTQEERLSALEQAVTGLNKGIRDLNHSSTILLGVTSDQGKDIREIKIRLADLSERLDTFEQGVNNRFGALEQTVNSRFEAQDKKLDQIMLLLTALVSKPDQGA
jgi:hypothetical protein